ncbi:hypothetical protein FZEAL_4714 [Fusarium zealandicum]|uniref:RNA polymerase II transcription factor SIII subunit A n=1 Tax=Fusarium zealandicum TaxID=1053134 RepID=A0A8H4UM08_9HYPO|nr:hypothetical protein FZEAL_4714 [Fusarium zealandicum]
MPVKSLMQLATSACIKNIRELEGVGDFLPYENVRPILLRVENAHQLRKIEINSPQIEGEAGEIWLKIIERDFPMEYKAKAYKPQNPKKWFRVWEKYKKDHDLALEESERKLMDAFAGLRETKQKATSMIVDRRLLPRAGRTGPKRQWGQRDSSGSTLAFAQGSRTKTHNGASVMRRVRRETKEIASIHGKLSRPVSGSAALTKVNKAPPGLVNEYRRAAQPDFRPTERTWEPSEAVTAHEERATFISDSESDQDEDLFDDEDEQPRRRSPPPRSNATASATSLLKKRPTSSSGPVRGQPSSSNSASSKPLQRAQATDHDNSLYDNSSKTFPAG